MKHPSLWDVYVVTDRTLSRGRSTLELVQAAVEGGVSAVQLREKDLPTRDFYHEGLKIRDFLAAHGVPLIINDRIDIALALNADGVHLGQQDMPVSVARHILGQERTLGLSIEMSEQINREAVACADYLAISPIFSTDTKADHSAPWGLDGLARARCLTDLPLVAIGSIKVSNAQAVAVAGADCVAVVTAVTLADDPVAAVRELRAATRAGKRLRTDKMRATRYSE
jgi:thiamine-phosphate pyrophosphorylase